MYTRSIPSGTIRLGDTIIPQDDREQLYRDYVAWLMLGNGPAEIPDPVDPYPRIAVPLHHLILALVNNGQDEVLESAVLNSGNRRLIAGYRFANMVYSDCDLVASARDLTGWSEAQAYEYFQQAVGMASAEPEGMAASTAAAL